MFPESEFIPVINSAAKPLCCFAKTRFSPPYPGAELPARPGRPVTPVVKALVITVPHRTIHYT